MLIYYTADANPDPSIVRCLPAQWCVPTTFHPVKIWDDSGAGGGKPGSIWVINTLGMTAIGDGLNKPTGETFYELSTSRFFMDPSIFVKTK